MWHQHDCIILDACCVLTLYASGRMTEILESVPIQTMLSRYVLEEEALYTYCGPDGDERSAKEPVGLTPLRNQGLIEVSSLSGEAEIRSFVDLASRLDDGEARTIAMAINRNWGVATDEKKASRILREVAPKIQIITTPDLVKHWTDMEGISDAEVAVVLRSVHKRGVYRPGRSHPLSGWWDSYFSMSP